MQGLIWDELTQGFAVIPFEVVTVRVLASMLLGGIVGAEREWRRRPAGLRTHILVSLAACVYAVVGREIVALDALAAGDNLRVDPMNLIGAVTAGVAFLVAGIIFTSEGKVRNVTTGASLWLSGAIGLACGAGLVPLAAMATAAVMVVLLLLTALVSKGPDEE